MQQQYYINAGMLRREGACDGMVKQFRGVFGDGDVPLTINVVQRALDASLPVYWPAAKLFMRAKLNSKLEAAACAAQGSLYEAQLDGDARKALRLLRKTAKLWARYHKGER